MNRGYLTAEHVFERWYPAGCGLATAALTLWGGPAFFKAATKHQWHIDQLYAGPFTVSTVVTGLLFAFYALVATSDRGFLARARVSTFYKTAVRYCMHALALGGVMVVSSLAFLFLQPAPTARDWTLCAIACWAAVAVWSFVAAGRATYIFTIFAHQPDR